MVRPPRARGFTLIELLVVIGIIAVLISILMPALVRSRENARAIQCASQLHQLGVALTNYAANNKTFPSWSGWHTVGGDGTGDDDPGPGWTEMLAPYYVAPTSAVYNCPSFPEGYPINYFLSARWLRMNRRLSLAPAEIRTSSEFVLSGDTTHPHLYPPSLGTAPKTMDDCDKDDAVGRALAFFGSVGGFNVHRSGNNVLFGDAHVATFKKFDPQFMTYSPKEPGMKWKDIPSDFYPMDDEEE
jgi:prepilin-type N-terminal cleavage/methylation domain-containing protein/prepilin-type processing-associated H-X9-DG protein